MTRVLAIALLSACGAAPRPAPPISGSAPHHAGVPPLGGGGDRAYLGGEGLTEVAGDTGEHQIVTPDEIHECAVDARANVVWFLTEAGISVFDLEDRTIHEVIRGDVMNLEMIIDYPHERLGGEDALEFEVGAKLAMTAPPAISMEMGCDGDAIYGCYEADLKTPTPEVARRQAVVKRLAFTDPAYVATLVARGTGRTLWSPTPSPSPPPPPPALDASKCVDDPTRCGRLTQVWGTPLWLVTVANARGDFYEEARELWDPRTNEYLHVEGSKVTRSRTPNLDPAGRTDYAGLRISPHGVLSYRGALFDPHAMRFHVDDGAPHACGWANGGWRMSGKS